MNKLFASLDRVLPYITIIIVVGFLIFALSNTSISDSINAYISQTGNAKISQSGTTIVNRIVDGDTVELNTGEKIRLLNIDTPETVKPNTPVKCYGKEASQKLSNLTLNQEVFLTFDKDKKDRYGRSLNFIYLNENDANNQDVEKSVNAFLVRRGYARASIYSPNTTFKEEFNSWMQDAIDNKLGIWGKCSNPFEE